MTIRKRTDLQPLKTEVYSDRPIAWPVPSIELSEQTHLYLIRDAYVSKRNNEMFMFPHNVLDDFEGEAKEICEHNSWINYALPIHRMRELGFYDRSFDMIDERSLTKSEIRDYCAILFGEEHLDGIPDPFVDWKGFVSKISDIVHKGKHYWNPLKKKMMPLIDTKLLYRKYGHANCCTIM